VFSQTFSIAGMSGIKGTAVLIFEKSLDSLFCGAYNQLGRTLKIMSDISSRTRQHQGNDQTPQAIKAMIRQASFFRSLKMEKGDCLF